MMTKCNVTPWVGRWTLEQKMDVSGKTSESKIKYGV